MGGIEIVRRARENLSRALHGANDTLPDPGWRWGAYCLHARRQANRLRTPVEVIHTIQAPVSNVGFEARMVGHQLEAHAQLMERNCRELFPQFADAIPSFTETPLAFPETVTILDDRLVSSPLYNHVIHALRCLGHVRPQHVMEIGGGYGAPARLWMINNLHRPHVYIDVDFPESLFYAEVYLQETLPDHEIVYLHRGQAMPQVEGTRPSIILCPISSLEAILDFPIDLIVNTGSLQEMTDEYVAFYMDAIERSECNSFYSSNYFAQPIQTLMESMNMAAPVMGPNWHCEFKAYHDDPIRGVAELLLVRKCGHDESAALSEVRSRLQPPPCNGEQFLNLFDATRKVDDPDLLIACARAAVAGMPFVPKETLYLARRAARLSQLSDSDLELLTSLEQMAAEGRADSGIVDPVATTIRDDLISYGSVAPLEGRLKEHFDKSVVDMRGAERVLRAGQYGSLERLEANGSLVLLSGWALDRDAGQPAKMVHIFDTGALVRSIAPSMTRSEFGLGEIPIGFQALIPNCDLQKVAVVAEFADGGLGRVDRPANIAR
jgi:putative sugar O-methyltransferase